MSKRLSDFGSLLKQHRSRRDVSLKELGLVLRRSTSFLQKIEAAERKHDFSRDEVWRIVQHLRAWPPDCDDLLRAAGFSSDRTGSEERDVQRELRFSELWVFAREILDPDTEWFDVVLGSLREGKHYRYFTADPNRFDRLHRAMSSELGGDSELLTDRLECFMLPKDLFLSNFALYIPPKAELDAGARPEMSRIYGCGTKPTRGRADVFFTMSEDEASTLYQVLDGWRDRIIAKEPIFLSPMRQVFPPNSERISDYVASETPSFLKRQP